MYDRDIIYFFSNDNTSSRICSNIFSATTFSENLLLHSKHFFRAGSSGSLVQFNSYLYRELVLQSSYFFETATFSDLSLLLSSCYVQNSNFVRAKLPSSSYLLRINNLSGRILFRRRNLSRIKISIEELLFPSR